MQYNSFNISSDGDLFNMQRKAAIEYAKKMNSRSQSNQNNNRNQPKPKPIIPSAQNRNANRSSNNQRCINVPGKKEPETKNEECPRDCENCKKPCFFGGFLDNIKNMLGINSLLPAKEKSGFIGKLKFDDLLLLAVIFLIYKSENSSKDILYILGYLFLTGIE